MNIKKFTPTRCLAIFAFLLSANILMAQSQTPLDIALRHIEENYKSWELTQQDVNDLGVSSSHISTVSGAAHIYFQQQYQGIGIYNAITNVAISDEGKVVFAGENFTANIADRINTATPTLTAQEALVSALTHLGKTIPSNFSVKEKEDRTTTFEKGDFSRLDVKVSLSYFKGKDGNLTLSYGFYLDPAADKDAWQFHVDATTGSIVDQTSMLIECKHTDLSHRHTSGCSSHVAAPKTTHVKEALASTNSVILNSYRVFPFPTESPTHGDHEIVVNPEDLNASPLGWHDTGNNQYTITRGNNGHAMLDRNSDGAPDIAEPNGGADLDFDFPYDIANDEPTDVQDAAVVNLFYAGNFLHDWSYSYGFTEAAASFQVNNFGNGGFGNDGVQMYAQSGADIGSINNASMGTPPDGGSPSMNMFVWDRNDATGSITVEAPASISGNYATGDADYGPDITTTGICGEVVIVNDNVNNPSATDGCEEEFVNGAELEGRIALIDRGGCWFHQKTLNAQNYGAIAVIICNFEDPAMGMAGQDFLDDPTIPTLSLSNSDCQTIRQFAGSDLELCFISPSNAGPDLVDADFDNGIIAHEYAHGISNRLVGGANNAGCIPNTAGSEYMGEGWSDWVALVTTMNDGDTGDMPRGIGNFSVRLPEDGRGIRNYPYSTDMNVSPVTYEDLPTIGGNSIHGAGEIWCAMLWDLHWAFIDLYGWDADLNAGTGGNNMSMALVMEGMKLQPCLSGFVSGRDAILAADELLNDGIHNCMIWDVFARRGLGINADENDPASAGDGVASFESLETCVEELKIRKSVSPLLDAGEEIDVTLTVTNHVPEPEVLTNITVTEELPEGLTYVTGSESANVVDVTQNGNVITFSLGDMDYLDEEIVTYQLSTASDIFSIRKAYDAVEYPAIDALDWWDPEIVTGTGNQFLLSESDPYSGDQSWFVANDPLETQHRLRSTQSFTMDGDRPAIRFYSRYETEAGADGGLFEVSTDGGNTFQQLGGNMVRNGYPGGIQYATFVVPFLEAFSGESDGYQGTYVDMSDYAGQTVTFRFQFATDDNTADPDGGWWIDDFEYMDLVAYNSEVCVSSDQGDNACAIATEEGTIIESQISVSTSEPEANVQLGVYPNPTSDIVNITVASKQAQNVALSLVTLDGKVIRSMNVGTTMNVETFSLDVSDLPAGFYLVKAATDGEQIVEKVIIK